MPQPVAVFCAAAPQDTKLLEQWENHLLPLQNAGYITFWSERHLLAKPDRREQVALHLRQATLIVFLLSADFLANDECTALVTQALQRFRNGQVGVIPLLLRPVAWHESDLGALTCLPTNGRPVSQWKNRDEAFANCVTSIKSLAAQAKATAASQEAISSSPTQALPVSLTPASESSYYHTCVISYSTDDERFVTKLYNDLKEQGVPCWLAGQDGKLGGKLREEIYQAIGQLDKLLLVLSKNAIESKWVEEEVDVALDRESHQPGIYLLFPLRLDDAVLTASKYWAIAVRQRRIGDFCHWEQDAEYQRALQRVLRDLKV